MPDNQPKAPQSPGFKASEVPGVPNAQPVESPIQPDPAVELPLTEIKQAAADAIAENKFQIDVLGVAVGNPKELISKLNDALAKVRSYLPWEVAFDVNVIMFKNLHGEQVGASNETGEKLDPSLLLKPLNRLAAALYHEELHARGKVLNEGMVQKLTERYFGKVGVTEKYDKAVTAFERFASIFNIRHNAEFGAQQIYKLYYAGKFTELHDAYTKNAAKDPEFKDQPEKAEAFFKEVFPELQEIG